MSKVYLVGWSDVDSYSPRSVHKTYKGAVTAWHELRLELIERAKSAYKHHREFICARRRDDISVIDKRVMLQSSRDDERREIENLSNTELETMSNGIAETPFIQTFVLMA